MSSASKRAALHAIAAAVSLATTVRLYAHHDEYVQRSAADGAIAVADSKPATTPTDVSELERQVAYFDAEALMALVLRAPSPLQDELISVGRLDQLIVAGRAAGADLEAARIRRESVHDRLPQNYAVVPIFWSDAKPQLVQDIRPIDLARGVPRYLLVKIANQSRDVVDLSVRQLDNRSWESGKFTVQPGRTQLIPVEIMVDDPGADQMVLEFHSTADSASSIEVPVRVQEAARLRGKLRDRDRNEVWPGRVFVLGSDSQYRHGSAYAHNETLSQKQLLQFDNPGRYYKLPFFYSDGTFDVLVPPGKTRVKLERGFEHEAVESVIELQPGEVRDLELVSGRIIDMAARGWVSGDTHIHWVTNQWNVDLPLDLLSTVQRAEDLRVANNLTLLQRGPSVAFINPQQAPMGSVASHTNAEFHVEMGEEYRNEDLYGHLCFLNLKWLVQPIGTGSIIAGPDALDYPLNKTAILACREQGGISCEAHGLGGNKDVPVNVVHELTDSLDQINPEEYYDFLECGFRLPLTNGSDHPARVVGCARAYVRVEGEFSYDKWIEGIRRCRTFTTSGPLIFLQVNDADIGDNLVVTPRDVLRIKADVVSRYPIGNLEIVSNGQIIGSLQESGNRATVELELPAAESRWIVARCSPTDNYNAISGPGIAHTSAIYVNVDGKRRFVADKARLWIGRMEQHIRDIRTKGRFANDAQMEEAIAYVEDGIRRYREMIAADSNELGAPAQNPTNEAVKGPQAPAEAMANMDSKTFPIVSQIEAQPLLVQVGRLVEALDYIGNPLPPSVKDELSKLHQESDGNHVAMRIQQLLDPLCLASVEIDEGQLTAIANAGAHELVQQGWRNFLVKVCNRSGLTSRLRVESPQARSVPHAKQADVASRWMALSMFDGRPLQADLSGLELEYRIIQIYSRDVGPLEASLEFSVDPKEGSRGRQIREWRFNDGVDGWTGANQAEVAADDGAMIVTGKGDDPFVTAQVAGASGEMVLRFSSETSQDGVGQLFWWTEEQPEPDGSRTISFPLLPGGAQLYELPFKVDGVLAGVRIDPNGKPGTTRFDWIDLAYAHRHGETWDSIPLSFQAVPSTPVTLKIVDPSGAPAAAALLIRDRMQRVYPAQPKRLAPDLFFHPQVYRLDGEVIYLPPGEYEVRLWRGPHSIPQTKQLIVGHEPSTLSYSVERWIDPSKSGWWSGDHHIHAAGCLHYQEPTQGIGPEDMLRQLMGEDLNVGCCLTWGPCFDYQKRFFSAKVDNVSRYPYLLRYDVEISGFGSHASGHLNLLKLKQQIYPGGESKDHWPTLGMNALRWAKRQGAICGPAHSGHGLTRYVDRLDVQDGPHQLPHHNIPAYDGIGANEFIVDVTHEVDGPDGTSVPAVDFISTMNTPRQEEWNMWYHTLNCGFRVRASGETDFPCMSGERIGMGRVYVKTGVLLDFDRWVDGLRDGRSYVSDATVHLIDFQARPVGGEWLDVGDKRSEIQLKTVGDVEFRVEAAALLADRPSVEVELLVNGLPVEVRSMAANGQTRELRFRVKLENSSWVALRVFPNAHTNPFFVIVDDRPIRASKASAQWCLRGVDQCWLEKQRTYAAAEQDQARADYDHARRAYRRILEECER